jgi:hypothetical protein
LKTRENYGFILFSLFKTNNLNVFKTTLKTKNLTPFKKKITLFLLPLCHIMIILLLNKQKTTIRKSLTNKRFQTVDNKVFLKTHDLSDPFLSHS